MEEKDIRRTEEDSIQQPQQTGSLTPDGSILGGYDNNLPIRRESVASGNISNAFLSSMTATSEGIHKKYPNLELSESEEKLRTDKEGNKVRYTRRQKLTLLALTQELSKHSDDKEVKELTHYLDVTFHVIKMAFMTIIEYPSNIAGWLISNPLQFIMGFAII